MNSWGLSPLNGTGRLCGKVGGALLEPPLHSMGVTQTNPMLSRFQHVEDLGPGSTTRTRSKPRDHPAAPRGSDSPARW